MNDGVCASSLWRAREKRLDECFEGGILNARAVEFIATPGMTSELRNCIERSVLNFLDRQTGFAGAIVLTPHKEARRVLVLSLWRTEKESRENEWEFADEVQSQVGPLIDAFSRVRTYSVAVCQSSQMQQPVDAPQLC